MFAERFERVRARMADVGVDALLLSVGPDLPWLTGYTAMPLERLTMLVLPRDGDAVLVVPRLEAPRVVERPDVFSIHPWNETDDPISIVSGLVGTAGGSGGRLAVGDRTWARFLIDLQAALPSAGWQKAGEVVGPLRAVKDAAEVDATARRIITDAGYGDLFIHRTGHGIGVEEHEDPYIVAGNDTPLVAGHAFSIEPGIYVPGRFGLRLEDIVVAADAGPDALNAADHALAVVDA